jgi:hypothetical protein
MASVVRRNSNRAPRGVVALAVVFAAGFLMIGIYRLWGGRQVAAVDTRPAYQAAQLAGAFPVASPKQLPTGWRALSSDFSTTSNGGILRIRLRAPSGGAVRLIESAYPVATLLATEVAGPPRGQGEITIAGKPWQRYAGSGGVRTLALIETGRTVLIVGTARDRELRDLAGSL